MSRLTSLSQHVESYKFWGVVVMWAKERLEHEEIVARALATAVVRDGLILNSVDPRRLKAGDNVEFKGYPYVAYCPVPNGRPMVLRAEALEHLLSIVRRAETPSRYVLSEEFIFKNDFRTWLASSELPLPSFWYEDGAAGRAPPVPGHGGLRL